MKPLQISPETAQKLAAKLGVPLEHLLHMPQHILLQKLTELSKADGAAGSGKASASGERPPGEQS
jgi:tRNA A37 threonylcarbamoyltransferase TsaD